MDENNTPKLYYDGKPLVRKAFYLCDGKKCGDKCIYPKCKNTSDPKHAKQSKIQFDKPKTYWATIDSGMFEIEEDEYNRKFDKNGNKK